MEAPKEAIQTAKTGVENQAAWTEYERNSGMASKVKMNEEKDTGEDEDCGGMLV